jgi:Cdc6-like AAA superfamily ATPase
MHGIHHTALTCATTPTAISLQQDHDDDETEGDLLKQADAVKSSVGVLCAAADAAIKGDIVPNCATGVAECAEPVLEQQQRRLLDALEAFKYKSQTVPLRKRELAAVHSVVTAALAAGTGASVHVHGPAGSGKEAAVLWQIKSPSEEWCKQTDKLQPVLVHLLSHRCTPSAGGVYGAILEELKNNDCFSIGDVSDVAAEAKEQLEAVVFNSDLPRLIVGVHRVEYIAESHADQLQQLFEWTSSSKLILIATGKTELQILPDLQQVGIVPVKVVLEPYSESDLLAILSDRDGSAVQLAAQEMCAKCASGDARRAIAWCELAVKLALSDNSSEVTLRHMQQCIRLTKRRANFY